MKTQAIPMCRTVDVRGVHDRKGGMRRVYCDWEVQVCEDAPAVENLDQEREPDWIGRKVALLGKTNHMAYIEPNLHSMV